MTGRNDLVLVPGRDPQVPDGHGHPQCGAQQDRQRCEQVPGLIVRRVDVVLRPQRPAGPAAAGVPPGRKGRRGPCPPRTRGHGGERDDQKEPAGQSTRIRGEQPPRESRIHDQQQRERDVHENVIGAPEAAPVGMPVFDDGTACERTETNVGEDNEGETEHGRDLCPAEWRFAECRPEHDAEQDNCRERQPDEMPQAPLARPAPVPVFIPALGNRRNACHRTSPPLQQRMATPI